jgi:tRNA threonylcarbamoyladenosine biosynthesis protein TsaE
MRLISASVKDTLALGKRLAAKLKPGDIICLCGELGSGKTVLAKGIARGLGVRESEVASPTFVIMREYPEARIALYHFDLYRLESPAQVAGLGYEEYLYGPGVTVVEWAEKLGGLFPRECLTIKLAVAGKDKRRVQIVAAGRRYEHLLRSVR